MLQDTTLFKTWVPEYACQQHALCHEFRNGVTDILRQRLCPDPAIHRIFSFLCATCIATAPLADAHECTSLSPGHHLEQATLAQFVANISCNFALNLDYAAEAKKMPKKTKRYYSTKMIRMLMIHKKPRRLMNFNCKWKLWGLQMIMWKTILETCLVMLLAGFHLTHALNFLVLFSGKTNMRPA